MKINKLSKKNGVAKINLLDAEDDIFECEFMGAEDVQINTENLTYLSLSKDNLITLLEKMEIAEAYYKEYYRKEAEKEDKMEAEMKS
jgi:hypothetical protein